MDGITIYDEDHNKILDSEKCTLEKTNLDVDLPTWFKSKPKFKTEIRGDINSSCFGTVFPSMINEPVYIVIKAQGCIYAYYSRHCHIEINPLMNTPHFVFSTMDFNPVESTNKDLIWALKKN